jgi:hypothetical protein
MLTCLTTAVGYLAFTFTYCAEVFGSYPVVGAATGAAAPLGFNMEYLNLII